MVTQSRLSRMSRFFGGVEGWATALLCGALRLCEDVDPLRVQRCNEDDRRRRGQRGRRARYRGGCGHKPMGARRGAREDVPCGGRVATRVVCATVALWLCVYQLSGIDAVGRTLLELFQSAFDQAGLPADTVFESLVRVRFSCAASARCNVCRRPRVACLSVMGARNRPSPK